MVEVIILGRKQAQNYLKNSHKKIESNLIPQGLKNAALHGQGEVKQSIAGRRAEPTSVDTGRFLNSVDVKFGKDNAVIYSPISYAKFLEFGRKGLSPRRHFGNTGKRNKNKFTELINKEVKKIK